MDNPRRIVGAIVLLAALASLTGLLIFWNAAPPAETKLNGLIGDFIKCLPQDVTPAEREEILGIMNRFYKRAMGGKVHPKDIVEIQNDLGQYIAKGTIPRSELPEFLSKVGKATRRLDSGNQQPED
jgi:hypothetical protein